MEVQLTTRRRALRRATVITPTRFGRQDDEPGFHLCSGDGRALCGARCPNLRASIPVHVAPVCELCLDRVDHVRFYFVGETCWLERPVVCNAPGGSA